MDIHRYQASSPAEAFEAASRDASKWNLSEMEAFAEMAQAFREGYTPMAMGSSWMCSCYSGTFTLLKSHPSKGYGIGIVSIRGHEVGVADPIASELLKFHRSRRGVALFAEQLLVYSEAILSVADLDSGYQILEEAGLIERAGNMLVVRDENGQDLERPGFICHRLPGLGT